MNQASWAFIFWETTLCAFTEGNGDCEGKDKLRNPGRGRSIAPPTSWHWPTELQGGDARDCRLYSPLWSNTNCDILALVVTPIFLACFSVV